LCRRFWWINTNTLALRYRATDRWILKTLMAQVVVRNLEENVKARLKRRAARHGRSMEEELREILRNAAREESPAIARLGSRIAARFRKVGLKANLPELRRQRLRAADLAE